MSGELIISKISARGLPDADAESMRVGDVKRGKDRAMDGGSSDPYIKFELKWHGQVFSARTPTVPNGGRNVDWKSALRIPLPSSALGDQATLVASVWDDDGHDSDDQMGSVEVELQREHGEQRNLRVEGRGKLYDFKISFEWQFVDLNSAPREAHPLSAPTTRMRSVGPHVDMNAYLSASAGGRTAGGRTARTLCALPCLCQGPEFDPSLEQP